MLRRLSCVVGDFKQVWWNMVCVSSLCLMGLVSGSAAGIQRSDLSVSRWQDSIGGFRWPSVSATVGFVDVKINVDSSVIQLHKRT